MADFKAVGPFHQFGPAGLAFTKPAELYVPFDGKGAAADTLGMAWSADGTTWERLETSVDETAGEMRAEILHFSKGGPGAWNQPSQVCCIVDLGPKGMEVSLSTHADCNDALSRNPGAKVTILFDLDRCTVCCADDWTKKNIQQCQKVSALLEDCDLVCCQVGGAASKVVAAGQCEAEGGQKTGLPETCTVCCADDWTKKPLVDCKQPAANEMECDVVCCASFDPDSGESKLELMTAGACQEDDENIVELDAKDCDTVCCTVTEGAFVTVSLVSRKLCEDLGLGQNKFSVESEPDECAACCADDWTKKPLVDCKQPAANENQCDPVCCHKGDASPSWVIRGLCVAEGGTPGNEPESECGGCKSSYDCMSLDTDPHDCITVYCIAGQCISAPSGEGALCVDGNACTVEDRCDASGNCKGQPQVCDDPPGPKECYVGACNPASGQCEYALALGATCGKDSDCGAYGLCVGCSCAKPCASDWDCPDDNRDDCMKPHCWNQRCEFSPAPYGSKCDDGDPCTKDDQCTSNGECRGTPMDPSQCPVCCGDDWTFKPLAKCPVYQQDSKCDKTCCEVAGKMRVLAVGACEQTGGIKMSDCQVCCEESWKVTPFILCPQAAAPVEECDSVCCVKENRFDVLPRGKCTNALFVLDPAACGFVCCSDTAAGKTAITVVPKWVCDGIATQPGHTVTQSPHENCAVCCLDGFTVKPWKECPQPANDESQCEKVCCEILGSKHVVTRAECSDQFETTTPLDQCFNPKLSTCAQPVEVFAENSAVIRGPFPTPTSTETAEGCPDTWYPGKWPDKTNGPDGVLPVRVPAGSRVVAAAYAKGKRVSTQIKPPCGQSGCHASSWGNKRPEYPVFHEISEKPYPPPANDMFNDLYSVSRGESIAERWTATVKETGSSQQPKVPLFLPMTPFAPWNMDDPGETLDARVVFDSWQEPGQTIEGDFTAWYRVVDGPPPNDTAAGAIVLEEGMPVVPETFAFARDDYQAAGCAAVPNGTGAGKPDLFYSFIPSASGVYRLEIGLLTEDPPVDAFFSVLDPVGSCVASGWGGAPFRSPVTLAANTTYTLVVDAGSLSENAVFFVQVDRYNIPGDPAHQGPLNYSCTSAQKIASLPFSAEAELSIGFNHIRPQMSCAAILESTFLHGDRDLLWSYTPQAEQYVRFQITSLSAGFRPTLLLFEACVSEWPATECLDAVRVPSGQTATSFVRKLKAGKTYFIAAEGGSDAPGAVRIELEAATNPDPDNCSNPLVLTDLPAKVTLNARNFDDDVSGSGKTPADGFCCGPAPCAPVGQGLADAVLAYTATQNGVLDVKFGSGTQGMGTLYATTDVCPSGVLDACSSLSRKATDISVRLDVGQTAYVVVDGWDNGWFQEITVEASFQPRPTNESCASAKPVTVLPWEETATLAFTANDVTAYQYGHCSPLVQSYGDYTSGGDLVWTYDPGATEKDLVVGLLSANFSGYNEPSLYVLESCGPMPTSDCWDEFIYGSGSYVSNDVTLWGVDAPIWIVVDHKAQDVPGTFTWMAQEVTVPPNDTCAKAILVTGLPFRHVANNVAAVNDYFLPNGNTCESSGQSVGLGPDVVYRLDITADLLAAYKTIQVDATAASFSMSLMAMRNGCTPSSDCVKATNYRYLTVPLSGFVAGDALYIVVDGSTDNTSKGTGLFVMEVKGGK